MQTMDVDHRLTQSEPREALIAVASALLQQASSLLRATITDDEQLCRTSKLIPGGTIGKHLRHIHDHFRLLLDSTHSTDSILNYDARQRNVAMETNRDSCLQEFEILRERLQREARTVGMDHKLMLHAVTPYPQEFETNFGRELWFSSLHAIHHFSSVRVIVVSELGLQVPHDFGVAPSTLAFRQFGQASTEPKAPKL